MPKNACVVDKCSDTKCYKNASINDYNLIALLDTGNDMSFMPADCYIKMGVLPLKQMEIQFIEGCS